MATQEGTGQSKHFIIKSLAPDICKSPGSPVPYDIVAFLDESMMTSPNVNFKKVPVFNMASRVVTVWGDEEGIGGGLVSMVNKGFCKPIVPVTTVKCNNFETCRHEHTLFLMNGASPEGPFNTIGKVEYIGAMGPGPIAPGGNLPVAANGFVAAQTPGELGCLPKLDQLAGASSGGLGDIVGLAQQAYNLKDVDWSNPSSVLGAIGGLAGAAGFDGIADMAKQANQLANLANIDFSNPGSVLNAAMGLAGPMMNGQGGLGALSSLGDSLLDGAASLGSGLLDAAGKIWTLPNTLLGLGVGGVGHLGQQLANWYDPSKYDDPDIGFGNNAIEFTNNPFGNLLVPSGDAAVTLGNSIIYSDGPEAHNKQPGWGHLHSDLGSHEQAHTIQAQVLGPLYLPAWGMGAAVAAVQGKPDPFGHDNMMETGPYNADKPWTWWPW